jgi:hypothetical protein
VRVNVGFFLQLVVRFRPVFGVRFAIFKFLCERGVSLRSPDAGLLKNLFALVEVVLHNFAVLREFEQLRKCLDEDW